MNARTRRSLVGVGFLALGLVLGAGFGAVAGNTLSPGEPAADSTTSTSTSTTVPRAEEDIPAGQPMDLRPPAVTAIGVPDGTIVALSDGPSRGLLVEVAGGVARELTTGASGPVAAVGGHAAAHVGGQGVALVPHDGSTPTLLTGVQWTVFDSTIAWLDTTAASPTVRGIDLDDPDLEAFEIGSLPTWPADRDLVHLAAADEFGAVIGVGRPASSLHVANADGTNWQAEGSLVQVMTGDAVAVFTNDAVGDPTWFDRRTGETSEAPTRPPAPDVGTCSVASALGETVLWQCDEGFAVDSPWGADSFRWGLGGNVNHWASLIDDGSTAVWFTSSDGGPYIARLVRLPDGRSGSVRSGDHPITAISP